MIIYLSGPITGSSDFAAVFDRVRRELEDGGKHQVINPAVLAGVATMALRRGMPLEMVSKMLRHENLQTTMRYLDLTEEELFYQHQKYVV